MMTTPFKCAKVFLTVGVYGGTVEIKSRQIADGKDEGQIAEYARASIPPVGYLLTILVGA